VGALWWSVNLRRPVPSSEYSFCTFKASSIACIPMRPIRLSVRKNHYQSAPLWHACLSATEQTSASIHTYVHSPIAFYSTDNVTLYLLVNVCVCMCMVMQWEGGGGYNYC
jgi:hypothetical protein